MFLSGLLLQLYLYPKVDKCIILWTTTVSLNVHLSSYLENYVDYNKRNFSPQILWIR